MPAQRRIRWPSKKIRQKHDPSVFQIWSAVHGLGKRGAGLGIATGAIVLTVVNFYIGKVQQQAGLLGDMAGIAHLGGLDVALSIIIGAVVVRATLQATKIFVTKAGS